MNALKHGTAPANPVDLFVAQIEALNETQYGDFMRRANAYLLRLEEAVAGSNPRTKAALADVRARLVYRPTFDVEAARRALIETARSLR